MGLFDRIFKRQERVKADTFFQSLTAYRPAFTNWHGALYESELVRAAIDGKARHVSKLKVEIQGAAQPRLQTAIKHQPNSFMTWSQFLYRLSTILSVNNNAFILPVKDDYNRTVGFFPALPESCQIIEGRDGREYLKYSFVNGKVGILPRSECGIMTSHQYRSDFFGEANNCLNHTMDLVEIQNQGIKEAVKNSNTFRFMAKLGNFSKDTDLKQEQERFSETAFKSESGVILFPYTWGDIKQIDSKPYTVDAAQMDIIKTNVFNYFGINEKVLQNSAQGDELDAFFNGSIEPFAIQLSEVLTKMCFSEMEQSNGAQIVITANRLQYMSTTAKISLAQQLGDRGMLTINEVRELFNYAPIAQGDGATIRGEYFILNNDGTITKKEGE